MTFYLGVKAFHIMLLAAWVGMDSAQFISSFFAKNPKLHPQTRWMATRIANITGMGPRTSFPLILASGLLLAYVGGFGFSAVPLWLIVVAEVAAIAWVWGLWEQFFVLEGKLVGRKPGWKVFFDREFRTFDRVVRFIIGAVMVVISFTSMFGRGPVDVFWVDWKVLLFGVVLLSSTVTRIVSLDYPVALSEIAREGSTPEREARINRALRHAYPLEIGRAHV